MDKLLDLRRSYVFELDTCNDLVGRDLHVLAKHRDELLGVHLWKPFQRAVCIGHGAQRFTARADNFDYANALQFTGFDALALNTRLQLLSGFHCGPSSAARDRLGAFADLLCRQKEADVFQGVIPIA